MSKTLPSSYTSPTLQNFLAGEVIDYTDYRTMVRALHWAWANRAGSQAPGLIYSSLILGVALAHAFAHRAGLRGPSEGGAKPWAASREGCGGGTPPPAHKQGESQEGCMQSAPGSLLDVVGLWCRPPLASLAATALACDWGS